MNSFTAFALARLRNNKRSYRKLTFGIFLTIFLVTCLCLSLAGIYTQAVDMRKDRFGSVDMFLNVESDPTRTRLAQFDNLAQVGLVYTLGSLENGAFSLGCYDETAIDLYAIAPVEGRLPETTAELAVEKSVMEALGYDWALGDAVTLPVTPIDPLLFPSGAQPGEKTFTLVGFLPERTAYTAVADSPFLRRIPAFVTGRPETLPRASVVLAAFQPWVFPAWQMEQALGMTDFQVVELPGKLSTFPSGLSEESAVALVLALAIFIACATGIRLAMEQVLALQQEDAAILRALGATRKQLRKIYGRESLVLAALVGLPAIFAGWAVTAVGFQALGLPFSAPVWSLIPITLGSLALVILGGCRPLAQFAKGKLPGPFPKRSKPIASRKGYRLPWLMAFRQLKLYPRRQLWVTLLLAAALLVGGFLPRFLPRSPSEGLLFYTFFNQRGDLSDGVYQTFPRPTEKDLEALEALPGISQVVCTPTYLVYLQVDQLPEHLSLGTISDLTLWYPEDYKAKTWHYRNPGTSYDPENDLTAGLYEQFRQTHGIEDHIFVLQLEVRTREELANMALDSGRLDLDALDAGREVILSAPDVWANLSPGGSHVAFGPSGAGKNFQYHFTNQTFSAGDDIHLEVFYQEPSYGPEEQKAVQHLERPVTIGAVTQEGSAPFILYTTPEGAKALALPSLLDNYGAVYAEAGADGETLAQTERAMERFALRFPEYSFINDRANEAARFQEQLYTFLLLIGLVVTLAAAAMTSLLSAVSRQLQRDKRTIAMLRAVGADEGALRRFCGSQLLATLGGALALNFLLLLCRVIASGLPGYASFWEIFCHNGVSLLVMMSVQLVLAGFLLALGWLAIGSRVKGMLSQSVAESLREL